MVAFTFIVWQLLPIISLKTCAFLQAASIWLFQKHITRDVLYGSNLQEIWTIGH